MEVRLVFAEGKPETQVIKNVRKAILEKNEWLIIQLVGRKEEHFSFSVDSFISIELVA